MSETVDNVEIDKITVEVEKEQGEESREIVLDSKKKRRIEDVDKESFFVQIPEDDVSSYPKRFFNVDNPDLEEGEHSKTLIEKRNQAILQKLKAAGTAQAPLKKTRQLPPPIPSPATGTIPKTTTGQPPRSLTAKIQNFNKPGAKESIDTENPRAIRKFQRDQKLLNVEVERVKETDNSEGGLDSDKLTLKDLSITQIPKIPIHDQEVLSVDDGNNNSALHIPDFPVFDSVAESTRIEKRDSTGGSSGASGEGHRGSPGASATNTATASAAAPAAADPTNVSTSPGADHSSPGANEGTAPAAEPQAPASQVRGQGQESGQNSEQDSSRESLTGLSDKPRRRQESDGLQGTILQDPLHRQRPQEDHLHNPQAVPDTDFINKEITPRASEGTALQTGQGLFSATPRVKEHVQRIEERQRQEQGALKNEAERRSPQRVPEGQLQSLPESSTGQTGSGSVDATFLDAHGDSLTAGQPQWFGASQPLPSTGGQAQNYLLDPRREQPQTGFGQVATNFEEFGGPVEARESGGRESAYGKLYIGTRRDVERVQFDLWREPPAGGIRGSPQDSTGSSARSDNNGLNANVNQSFTASADNSPDRNPRRSVGTIRQSQFGLLEIPFHRDKAPSRTSSEKFGPSLASQSSGRQFLEAQPDLHSLSRNKRAESQQPSGGDGTNIQPSTTVPIPLQGNQQAGVAEVPNSSTSRSAVPRGFTGTAGGNTELGPTKTDVAPHPSTVNWDNTIRNFISGRSNANTASGRVGSGSFVPGERRENRSSGPVTMATYMDTHVPGAYKNDQSYQKLIDYIADQCTTKVDPNTGEVHSHPQSILANLANIINENPIIISANDHFIALKQTYNWPEPKPHPKEEWLRWLDLFFEAITNNIQGLLYKANQVKILKDPSQETIYRQQAEQLFLERCAEEVGRLYNRSQANKYKDLQAKYEDLKKINTQLTLRSQQQPDPTPPSAATGASAGNSAGDGGGDQGNQHGGAAGGNGAAGGGGEEDPLKPRPTIILPPPHTMPSYNSYNTTGGGGPPGPPEPPNPPGAPAGGGFRHGDGIPPPFIRGQIPGTTQLYHVGMANDFPNVLKEDYNVKVGYLFEKDHPHNILDLIKHGQQHSLPGFPDCVVTFWDRNLTAKVGEANYVKLPEELNPYLRTWWYASGGVHLHHQTHLLVVMVSIKPDPKTLNAAGLPESRNVRELRKCLMNHQLHWREGRAALLWLQQRAREYFGDPRNHVTLGEKDANDMAALCMSVLSYIARMTDNIYGIIPYTISSGRNAVIDFAAMHTADFKKETMDIITEMTRRNTPSSIIDYIFQKAEKSAALLCAPQMGHTYSTMVDQQGVKYHYNDLKLLPSQEVPKFNGKRHRYKRWRADIDEFILKRPDIPPARKFFYLKCALRDNKHLHHLAETGYDNNQKGLTEFLMYLDDKYQMSGPEVARQFLEQIKRLAPLQCKSPVPDHILMAAEQFSVSLKKLIKDFLEAKQGQNYDAHMLWADLKAKIRAPYEYRWQTYVDLQSVKDPDFHMKNMVEVFMDWLDNILLKRLRREAADNHISHPSASGGGGAGSGGGGGGQQGGGGKKAKGTSGGKKGNVHAFVTQQSAPSGGAQGTVATATKAAEATSDKVQTFVTKGQKKDKVKSSRADSACFLCGGPHLVKQCGPDNVVPSSALWAKFYREGVCIACGFRGHTPATCQWSKPCQIDNCTRRHVKVLHFSNPQLPYSVWVRENPEDAKRAKEKLEAEQRKRGQLQGAGAKTGQPQKQGQPSKPKGKGKGKPKPPKGTQRQGK